MVHQVVRSFPPDSVAETNFGLIIPPADRYPSLSMNPSCAGLCTINQQHVTMFRAGEFASKVKAAGVTLAIIFSHMPSSPVLLLSVRAGSPQLKAAVCPKYAQAFKLANPVAEWLLALSPYARELVPAVVGADAVRLTVAKDSSSTSLIYLPAGRM